MIFCYTQTSALLSHQQRSLRNKYTDSQPHITQRDKLWNTDLHGMSPLSSSPQSSENLMEEEAEIV